jgi:hypothetical protein
VKHRLAFVVALFALSGATGCIDTDAAVFVEPSIEGPSADVAMSSLATALGGSFTLRLHLGARASGDSQVTVRQFSVSSADRSSEIVGALAVSQSPPSPVTVVRGGDDALVTVSFSADDNLLDTAAIGPLCDPAGIVIHGTLDDALLGATTPVSSDSFTAGMCP